MAKRKIPLGQPVQWAQSDLDLLANVTQADINRAGLLWRDNAPRRYRTLLDATTQPDELTNAGTNQ